MSWQDYVDNQLLASQCVSKAAIAGHDGGVWAKSEGFDVSWATYKLQHREYSILWMALIFFFFFSFLSSHSSSLSALSNILPNTRYNTF